MNTPPQIPPTSQSTREATLDAQISELITHKKRWDTIERELKELRDNLQIGGRINQKDKAMMILYIESGQDLFSVIMKDYSQYLYKDTASKAQKKGCLSVILLAIAPITMIAGWFIFGV